MANWGNEPQAIHRSPRPLLATTGLGLAAQAQKPAAPPGRRLQDVHLRLLQQLGRSTCASTASRWKRTTCRKRGSTRWAAKSASPQELASCHTAKVDGYYVEGHVPAADIQKMLKERPKITGIAAPGMPIGSPGMEQGGAKDPYDIVAFTKGGQPSVFVRHR